MLRNDPVPVAWRLTCDDHADRIRTPIHRLMLLARGNLDSFAGVKNKVMMFNFQSQFTFQNEEKLARMDVRMSGLTCAGRHEFFDDAEVLRFNEVPSIAVGSLLSAPFVVFGRFRADYLCRHAVLFQRLITLNTRSRMILFICLTSNESPILDWQYQGIVISSQSQN
jgi:hypothetical protein